MFEAGSIFSLVLQASWVAHLILGVLFLMSVFSWGMIFFKWKTFRQASKESHTFLTLFKKESEISEVLYLVDRFPNAYSAQQFESGYIEFERSYKKLKADKHASSSLTYFRERMERILDKSMSEIAADMETGIASLATVSSSAPFIGLLGTVIGIIRSFQNIGTQGVTSLAVVAPGISEALVATAFGLFAAIPALLGYNFFRNKIRIMNNEMRNFSLDMMNLFERFYHGTASED